MKGILTDLTGQKITLYCAGLMLIIPVWILLRADGSSILSVLNSVLLISLSYIAMIYDIKTKKIPNILVLIMAAGWLLLAAAVLITDTENGSKLLMDSMLGFLSGGGLFFMVYLVSRKGLGGGDVKFMAAAGLYLGFAGAIPAILYGTLAAALTGMILITLKKINRKDKIPLVPFLFIGIIIAA